MSAAAKWPRGAYVIERGVREPHVVVDYGQRTVEIPGVPWPGSGGRPSIAATIVAHFLGQDEPALEVVRRFKMEMMQRPTARIEAAAIAEWFQRRFPAAVLGTREAMGAQGVEDGGAAHRGSSYFDSYRGDVRAGDRDAE